MPDQPQNLGSSPAAPSGKVNVVFQADAPTGPPTAVIRQISAYMPPMTSTVGGAVPTPPNDATKFLNGAGGWTVPPGTGGGGGGGSNDDISYYDTPSTITPPTGLSWAYHTNAAYSFNNNGAMVIATYSSANGEVLGTTIPANDFDVIACMSAMPAVGGGSIALGLILWDSVSGKAVQFFFNFGGGTGLYIQTRASFTTAASTTTSVTGLSLGSNCPLWLRINYSYGKYTYYVSVDGQSWDQFYQQNALTYLPAVADHGGLVAYVSGSIPLHIVAPHFAINSYVGS